MEKISKIPIQLAILIGFIILGTFYYFIQSNKQDSIERQQRLELNAQKELNNKKYSAEQKSACLSIYETESKKWNNVTGWRYDDFIDSCYIQYKQSPKLTKTQCDEEYRGDDGKVLTGFYMDYLLCQDGLFEKKF